MASLVLIKPDAVRDSKVGEIISRLETFFSITAMTMMVAPRRMLEDHYKDHKGKPFYLGLINAMHDGPLVAVAVAGHVGGIRDSMMAYRAKILGTDYVGPLNLVHASDSPEAADRELELWFPEQ